MEDPQEILKRARRAKAIGGVDEAIGLLERYVAETGDTSTPRFDLARLLADSGRHAEAVAHLEHVVLANPEGDGAMTNLANSLMKLGRNAEARAWHGSAFGRLGRASTWSARLLVSNAVSELDDLELAEEHRAFDAMLGIDAEPCPKRTDRVGPMRVGFVSGDLRRHAVATFLEPVLEHLADRDVEPVAFATSTSADETTRRLRALCREWHSIAKRSDEESCALIRDREIDVLVDLGGHTSDHRLGIFARRAAPVQVTWLGYPNTTGLRSMDWRIVDEITDPPGSEHLLTERLLRVPPPFVCYRPPVGAPTGAGTRRPGPPTYGCFNFPGKISEAVVRLWSELLRRDDEAILLLKQYDANDPQGSGHIRRRFEDRGVGGDRIAFAPWTTRPGDHVDAYRDIDVALDPFPYNGTTTTCEAIHAGVPVVTLLGRSHRSRVGATLLSAIGEERLIAEDEEAYLEIAMAMRRDRPLLETLRTELPRRAADGPLGDAAAFAAKFAEALRSTLVDDPSS